MKTTLLVTSFGKRSLIFTQKLREINLPSYHKFLILALLMLEDDEVDVLADVMGTIQTKLMFLTLKYLEKESRFGFWNTLDLDADEVDVFDCKILGEGVMFWPLEHFGTTLTRTKLTFLTVKYLGKESRFGLWNTLGRP